MLNPPDKEDTARHSHTWEREERMLEDGFSYYYMICRECHEVRFPATQLQRLQDYSKEHLFLFVEDWVLLLLYAGREFEGHEYIAGITLYQKMLFLAFYEFAPKHNIPTENPGFYGYKYGPYSARIDNVIDLLIQYGFIKTKNTRSSSTERFTLTPTGLERGRRIFNKLSKDQQDNLIAFRKYWDQKRAKGICKIIYANPRYKEFIQESIILSDLFPGRELHRMREEKVKWSQLKSES
jgi:hypothetical protein